MFDSKAITEVTIADLATVLRKHEKTGKFATRERDQARTRKVNAAAVALSNSDRSALRPD